MKHAGTTRLHRFLAMLLSLAMMLSVFAFPAAAQEDWTQLMITLSWQEGDMPMSVTAARISAS